MLKASITTYYFPTCYFLTYYLLLIVFKATPILKASMGTLTHSSDNRRAESRR